MVISPQLSIDFRPFMGIISLHLQRSILGAETDFEFHANFSGAHRFPMPRFPPRKSPALLYKGICLGKMMVNVNNPQKWGPYEYFLGEKWLLISGFLIEKRFLQWPVGALGYVCCINWGWNMNASVTKRAYFTSHDSQGSGGTWTNHVRHRTWQPIEWWVFRLWKNGRKHWHHVDSKLTFAKFKAWWCLLTFSQIESRFLTAFRCEKIVCNKKCSVGLRQWPASAKNGKDRGHEIALYWGEPTSCLLKWWWFICFSGICPPPK